MPDEPQRILIIGGTEEARFLAARLEADARFTPITSLAGVTRAPAGIAGEVRTGGFGGPEGLRRFLEAEGIIMVIDAAHPFAVRISASTAEACAAAQSYCLRLERPRWEMRRGDRWMHVADVAEAARAIPAGARALVTVGRQEIAPFFERSGITLVARMIEPPEGPVPDHAEVVQARPPFTCADELALMRDRSITVLVSKNSGGAATYAKIEAARELGVPVIMVARPEKVDVAISSTVDELMVRIEKLIA